MTADETFQEDIHESNAEMIEVALAAAKWMADRTYVIYGVDDDVHAIALYAVGGRLFRLDELDGLPSWNGDEFNVKKGKDSLVTSILRNSLWKIIESCRKNDVKPPTRAIISVGREEGEEPVFIDYSKDTEASEVGFDEWLDEWTDNENEKLGEEALKALKIASD